MLKDLIKRKLATYVRTVLAPDVARATAAQVVSAMRRERLTEAAVNSRESGVAAPGQHRSTPVVVSLTTYGRRLHEVHLAIESIMQGTVRPDAIVLWRDENDVRPLPVVVERQVARGLQVMPTRDLRSFKKLIPALREFHGAHIVTIDDDVFYPHDMLETMLATHDAHPGAIIANTVLAMERDAQGVPCAYRQWPYVDHMPADGTSSDLFFEGFGGVLYPAGSLPPETLDEEAFTHLCPTADDVWFNAMARLAATPLHICQRSRYDFLAAVNDNVQADALFRTNNGAAGGNDRQLRNVWQRYNLQGR